MPDYHRERTLLAEIGSRERTIMVVRKNERQMRFQYGDAMVNNIKDAMADLIINKKVKVVSINEIDSYVEKIERKKRIKSKIKRFINRFAIALALAMTIGGTTCIISGCSAETKGHYEADYEAPDGTLVDTDGDGDYHHWVED